MFPARYNAAQSFTLRLSSDSSGPSSSNNVIVAQPCAASKRFISELISWLKAWNVYVAVLVAHFTTRASSLLAYQHILYEAITKGAPQAWLKYDARFRAMAAEDHSL